MPSVPSSALPRNPRPLSALIDRCHGLGCPDAPTARELAREALYDAGFLISRPSFRTHDAEDPGVGAVVELLGELLLEERAVLAMDVLSDYFTVRRDGALLFVTMRGAEAPAPAAPGPGVVDCNVHHAAPAYLGVA